VSPEKANRTSSIPDPRPLLIDASCSLILAGGTVADILVHQPDLLDPNRFPAREALPGIISEHIGNFGPTAVPLVIIGAAAAIAKNRHLDAHKQLAFLTKLTFIGVVLANLLSERHFLEQPNLLVENLGDLGMGGLALITSAFAIEAIDRRLAQAGRKSV
jgi:hypothetical protein